MGEGPGLVERSGEGGVDAEGEVIVGLTPTKIKGVDTFTQMWALVETDADVTSAIKDVRTRLGEYHEKGHKNQPHLADLEGEGTHVHAHTRIYTTYIEVVGRTYMCACTLHDMYLADLVGAGTLYVQLLCAKLGPLVCPCMCTHGHMCIYVCMLRAGQVHSTCSCSAPRASCLPTRTVCPTRTAS